MKSHRKFLMLILILLLLSSCTPISEPPPPIKPPNQTPSGAFSIPEITPLPIHWEGTDYLVPDGKVCLEVDEHYLDTGHEFEFTVGEMLTQFLKGLGYSVISEEESGCDLEIRLSLDIKVQSGEFSFMGQNKYTCHNGILTEGIIDINLPQQALNIHSAFGDSEPLPDEVDDCYDSPPDWLLSLWQEGFLDILEGLWGPEASVALLSIDSGDVESQQLSILQGNASAGIGYNDWVLSSVSPEYVVYAAAKTQDSRMIEILSLYDPELLPDLSLLVLPWLAELRDTNSDLQKIPSLTDRVRLLRTMQPDPESASWVSNLLIELAIRKGDWENIHENSFQYIVREVVTLQGPEAIPVLVWTLYNYKDNPGAVNLAAGILGRLIEAGYREPVGQQAGETLCYLLYQMSENEIPNANGVRYALRELFSEKSDSHTKMMKYYRWWKSEFG